MKGWPAVTMVVAMAAVVLGLPFGFYALLTRERRRVMREIRRGCSREGWHFRHSILRGSPTEFNVDGRTQGGIPWLMKCRNASEYNRGWAVRLALRFPALAGQTDFAILPRDHGQRDLTTMASRASPEAIAKIGKFSGSFAGAVEFLKDAGELPSGFDAFDRGHQILVTKDGIRTPLVDAAFAKGMLEWPTNEIKPHSWLAWRDPFGLHVEVRLPGPPNLASIVHFHRLGETLAARIPPATASAGTGGIVDRIAEKLLT